MEQGDALRGTSICLFNRIFGESQKPSDGQRIDSAGEQPLIYAGDSTPNPLHREIWERFWDYANDTELANEIGVRAVHGEAPFIEARPGKTYWLELRGFGRPDDHDGVIAAVARPARGASRLQIEPSTMPATVALVTTVHDEEHHL